jgi:hypothetical protein
MKSLGRSLKSTIFLPLAYSGATEFPELFGKDPTSPVRAGHPIVGVNSRCAMLAIVIGMKCLVKVVPECPATVILTSQSQSDQPSGSFLRGPIADM